jgi:hypothetical protein
VERIRNVRNDFGSLDTYKDTTVASAVAIATKRDRESAFETLDSTTNANTDGRTAATGSSDGVITETRSAVNRFGRFDELIETRTSKEKSAKSFVVTPLLYSETTTTIHSETESSSSTGGGAGIYTDSSTPDEFGRFTRRETTESPSSKQFSASFTSDGGGGSYECGVNASSSAAAAVAGGMNADNINSFSANINKYGLINYSASSRAPDDDASRRHGTFSSYTITMNKKIGDVWWPVTVRYTFTRSMAAASVYCAGTVGTTIGGYGGHTTGVKMFSNGMRAGCRVSVADDTPGF